MEMMATGILIGTWRRVHETHRTRREGDRARHLALVSVKNSRIVADHEALLALIEAKDKEGASDLIKKHLDRYKIDTSAIRETYPQYFKAEI